MSEPELTPVDKFETLRADEIRRLEYQNEGLVRANREMFALYAESMREITKIHAEMADCSETMDGLSKRLCAILRKLRKHVGADNF
jgi:hypothetical protein